MVGVVYLLIFFYVSTPNTDNRTDYSIRLPMRRKNKHSQRKKLRCISYYHNSEFIPWEYALSQVLHWGRWGNLPTSIADGKAPYDKRPPIVLARP